MKKYLLLIIVALLTPIIAYAEPIHLTQSIIDEVVSTNNVTYDNYKITFFVDNSSNSGLMLNGGEYILDEDIDLHKANIDTTTDSLVLNLNGHKITNELDSITGYRQYSTVGGAYYAYDLTINGPGEIYYSPYSSSDMRALISYGKNWTINDVTVYGYGKYMPIDGKEGDVRINNSHLTWGFQNWGGNIYIENSILGDDPTNNIYNKLEATIVYVNNSTLYSGTSDALAWDEHNGSIGKLTVTNSKIIGRDWHNGVRICSKGEVVIENSELVGLDGLYIQEPVTISLADVHLLSSDNTRYHNSIGVTYDTTLEMEELFATFLKEGYIYWKDPVYELYNGNYFLGKDDMWIIKAQQEYTSEDSTYVIPEENEIIIKVLGYKYLLEGLKINGTVLSDDLYEVLDNTTNTNEISIKLNPDYLKTLGEDNYQVEVVFANGSSTSKLSVKDIEVDENPTIQEEIKGEEETVEEKKNPKTGLFNYMILLLPLAIVGIVYLVISKKTYFKGM